MESLMDPHQQHSLLWLALRMPMEGIVNTFLHNFPSWMYAWWTVSYTVYIKENCPKKILKVGSSSELCFLFLRITGPTPCVEAIIACADGYAHLLTDIESYLYVSCHSLPYWHRISRSICTRFLSHEGVSALIVTLFLRHGGGPLRRIQRFSSFS